MPLITVNYNILTPLGGGVPPFQVNLYKTPEAPGDQLRVSEKAMLVGFEYQPDVVFCRHIAGAYGYILWPVNGVRLHEDDLKEVIEFESSNDFSSWLIELIRGNGYDPNEKQETG